MGIEPLADTVRRAIQRAVAVTGSTRAAADALGIGWATVKRHMAYYADQRRLAEHRQQWRAAEIDRLQDELDRVDLLTHERLELQRQLTALLAEAPA